MKHYFKFQGKINAEKMRLGFGQIHKIKEADVLPLLMKMIRMVKLLILNS